MKVWCLIEVARVALGGGSQRAASAIRRPPREVVLRRKRVRLSPQRRLDERTLGGTAWELLVICLAARGDWRGWRRAHAIAASSSDVSSCLLSYLLFRQTQAGRTSSSTSGEELPPRLSSLAAAKSDDRRSLKDLWETMTRG